MDGNLSPISRINEMRRALAHCRFPPYTAAKRFARQVGEMPLEKVSIAQWHMVVCLAHRFRRQMPCLLVPEPGELAWAKGGLAQTAAAREAERIAKRRAKNAKREARNAPAPAPLLDQGSAP